MAPGFPCSMRANVDTTASGLPSTVPPRMSAISLDIIKYLVKPTGEFFPGFTLTAMVAGLLYGWFLYKRPISLKRVLAAELVVSIVCNMLMSTLWLSMLYGKGFMVLLPMRAVKNLIMWPINSMIFYTVAKTMEASGVFRTLKGYGN